MRIKSLIILAVGLLVLAGCSRPLDKRVESFVNRTEANCDKYTDADWEKSLKSMRPLPRSTRTPIRLTPRRSASASMKPSANIPGSCSRKAHRR